MTDTNRSLNLRNAQGDAKCSPTVIRITHRTTLAADRQRPQIIISGAIHGNERVVCASSGLLAFSFFKFSEQCLQSALFPYTLPLLHIHSSYATFPLSAAFPLIVPTPFIGSAGFCIPSGTARVECYVRDSEISRTLYLTRWFCSLCDHLHRYCLMIMRPL
jgi:hypothetical protein